MITLHTFKIKRNSKAIQQRISFVKTVLTADFSSANKG